MVKDALLGVAVVFTVIVLICSVPIPFVLLWQYLGIMHCSS